MFGLNPFNRIVLLMTVLSILGASHTSAGAKEIDPQYSNLLYPNALKTQTFDSEFNFHKHIVAVQYTSDSLDKVKKHYQQKMPEFGWKYSANSGRKGLDLGLGPNADSISFEKDNLICTIIILSKVENVEDTLISIEVTEKDEFQKELASIETIAKEIAPIPIFPGATNPIIFKSSSQGVQTTVSFETSFSVSHLTGYYRRHLHRLGYLEGTSFNSRSNSEKSSTTVYKKGDNSIIVGVSQEENGKTSVLLLLNINQQASNNPRAIDRVELTA